MVQAYNQMNILKTKAMNPPNSWLSNYYIFQLSSPLGFQSSVSGRTHTTGWWVAVRLFPNPEISGMPGGGHGGNIHTTEIDKHSQIQGFLEH